LVRVVAGFAFGVLVLIAGSVALVAAVRPPLQTGTLSGRIVLHPQRATSEATIFVLQSPPSPTIAQFSPDGAQVCSSCRPSLVFPSLQSGQPGVRRVAARRDGSFSVTLRPGRYVLLVPGPLLPTGGYLCDDRPFTILPGVETDIVAPCELVSTKGDPNNGGVYTTPVWSTPQ
jgi:hypothetical protein